MSLKITVEYNGEIIIVKKDSEVSSEDLVEDLKIIKVNKQISDLAKEYPNSENETEKRVIGEKIVELTKLKNKAIIEAACKLLKYNGKTKQNDNVIN